MPLVTSGQKINDYVLEEKIGGGAFSEVWRARHDHLRGQVVAIKVPSDLAFVRNLQKDVVVHGLHHSAIVAISGFNPYADPPYLIMELVPGRSLRELLKAAALNPADAISILRRVLAGLEVAHGAGIIHRDIKPENILIHDRAAKEGYAVEGLVKITDFGLAKVERRADGSIDFSGDRSMEGRVIGTLNYMPAAQRQGAPADVGSDLYACGTVFFEMLTGRLPQEDELPSEVNAACPKYLNAVFAKARTRPEKRYATAAIFAAALIPPLPARYAPQTEAPANDKTAPSAVAVPNIAVPNAPIRSADAKTTSGARTGVDALTRPIDPTPPRSANQAVMAAPVEVPHLGEGLVSATLLEWLRYDGDIVKAGEPLCMLETDKANVDLPSPADGVLRHSRKAGATVSVKEAIAQIEVTGDPGGTAARITNTLGMEFVRIEPGRFTMGSPTGEESHQSNETQHTRIISKPFHLATTTVTQKQWKDLMGDNPSRFKGDDLPVEQVSRNDAMEFIEKLNEKEKSTGRRHRLPTEGEWEYACRAGTMTPFSFGETISTDQANYDGNYTYGRGKKGMEYRQKTVAVKSFKPNPWGLYQMHGNVWEWCSSDYKDYENGEVIDPQNEEQNTDGTSRVLRGGSCYNYPRYCRSANRSRFPPDARDFGIGFRVCLDFA